MIGLLNLLPKVPVGKRTKSKLRSTVAAPLNRFARETHGNMSVLAICGSMVMLVFGGVGIDMIYSEVQRTKLQNTLDRAVLAAANLDQELDPTLVVNEYFSAMQMSDALSTVTVDQGLTHRIVTADAERDLQANFLKILGVETLHTAGVATAEERIQEVEISMVLDISGSMGWNGKIANLRDAATEFVETVIDEENSGLTTINIVPYNATVNLGTRVASYYDLENYHNYSRCAYFEQADFTTTALDPAEVLGRLGHFDPWSTSQANEQNLSPWCADTDYGSIIIHSSNETELTDHIASFGAGGNTAIDLGMKWGVALLDPSSRPVVNAMIADGHIVAEASGRPADYTQEDALKIVVLMTDGQNTTQYDLKEEFKTANLGGLSPIFYHNWSAGVGSGVHRYSVLVEDNPGTDNDLYFLEHFENAAYDVRIRNEPDGGADAVQLTWAEVFDRFGTRGAARKFYTQPYYDGFVSYNEYYDLYYAYEATVGPDLADSQLSTVCAEARDNDITVFAIGFEAPARGQAAMSDCASSPAHYFSVEGIEISDAFQQIARTINQLRLTQ